MAHFLKRLRKDRSLRVDAQPGKYSCAVKYTTLSHGLTPRWAQYGDISETGMKLISTKPHQTEVGTIVDVNFALVGGTQEVARKARVVRHGNEFVLGLEFVNSSDDFKTVFWQHAKFVSQLPWVWPLKRSKKWFAEHKIGLRIAVTAMTFFIFTASVIYLFSDEGTHRTRSWGEVYSDEIDLNYVKGFTQAK